jgi:hypothetical protein
MVSLKDSVPKSIKLIGLPIAVPTKVAGAVARTALSKLLSRASSTYEKVDDETD